jgi:2-keto-3-deoxy-L-rhamnonate aldolase RhmA
MYTPIQEFRAKLKAGQFCLGVGITLSDPAVTEALGKNVDFYWIDMEHTPLNMETLQAHLIAARAVGIPAIVRVPGSEVWFIKRVLDTGAAGIIVPQVRSAAEVKQVVDACRYKPVGDRGYGPRRASTYGRDANYLQRINEDLFVAVQIENVDALKEIDAISQIKGVDSLALGPYDLSASLGLMGQVAHPEVVGAIERVIKAAKANGLFVGMGGPANEEYILRGAKLGVQWQQAGSDFEYMIQYVEGVFATLAKKLPGVCQPGRSKGESRY